MNSKIYYAKPSITQVEIDLANDAVINGWGDHYNDYIERFENTFREYLGVKHTIATSSCTGALQLGLAGLDISSNDEIILADINWVATVAPVVHLKAKPILVDVLPDSWCLDPISVKKAITKKTKAIIATHLYGNLCEIEELLRISQEYNIPLIEDAAEAIGSMYHGQPAGSMGIFGVFSFHGSKTITTGEGGLLSTNDTELYNKIFTLSNHGRIKGEKQQFWPKVVGYKFKMSSIQAAIGLGQMTRIEELVDKKRLIFSWYKDKLSGFPLQLNPEQVNCRNGFWMPTAIINKDIKFNREDLLNSFKIANIDGRVFFWPLSMMSLDGIEKLYENKVSYDIFYRGINLPSYHDITENDVDRVVKCLKKSLKI
jgi:perosamine synthetase